MPLIMNPNTILSIIIVTPFYHDFEDIEIYFLLVRDGEIFSLLSL